MDAAPRALQKSASCLPHTFTASAWIPQEGYSCTEDSFARSCARAAPMRAYRDDRLQAPTSVRGAKELVCLRDRSKPPPILSHCHEKHGQMAPGSQEGGGQVRGGVATGRHTPNRRMSPGRATALKAASSRAATAGIPTAATATKPREEFSMKLVERVGRFVPNWR